MKEENSENRGLALHVKLILSLSAIAVVLLVTAVISILEYRSMSDHVTAQIGNSIDCINVSQKVANATDLYNHKILATVGAADSLAAVTNFDRQAAADECRRVFDEFYSVEAMPVLDELRSAFDVYILETEGLETIVRSTFVDSREWFFNSLQPAFNEFNSVLETYNEQVHLSLMEKADAFQMGFYRSIIPGIVSVLAGLLLIALLLFFLIVNYVRPLYKMLGGMDAYKDYGKRYTYTFEGDDQLQRLNSNIFELIEENIKLKRSIKFRNGTVTDDQEQQEDR